MTVHADAFTSAVDTDGSYRLHGFPAGTVMVIPTASDAVFVLSNQLVNVRPDVVGVNFNAYQSNAFVIERLSDGMLRPTFAGAAGETWRVFTSSNLSAWLPYSTNAVAVQRPLRINSHGYRHFIETLLQRSAAIRNAKSQLPS